MNSRIFYSFNEDQKKSYINIFLEKYGKCTSVNSGLCGDIYIFDQGENCVPRYVCAKVPKITAIDEFKILEKRFLIELQTQLSYFKHNMVHVPFGFTDVMGTPVALFRYWGSDLKKLISGGIINPIESLSIIIYVAIGLRHCYKNGLIAHQDLKPANIFLRDVAGEYKGLLDLDIYKHALIADFGLANAASKFGIYDGARPYMAPEQWDKSIPLSQSTDVFALGVILFEALTGGTHPVGIQLNEFWPTPKSGNSKKWTTEKPWKKWIKDGCPIMDNKLSPKIERLIKMMLSIDPENRPNINLVIKVVLEEINDLCIDSYEQVKMLINYFDSKSCSNSLKEQHPYLHGELNKFIERFSYI